VSRTLLVLVVFDLLLAIGVVALWLELVSVKSWIAVLRDRGYDVEARLRSRGWAR
jgi:hypothetical protein